MPPKYNDKNLKAPGHPMSSERKPRTRAHDQAGANRHMTGRVNLFT